MTSATAPRARRPDRVGRAAPGFLGGKLSGAGWAGCTVNLVASDQADAFAESVSSDYARRTGTVPAVHVCHAADGATAVDLDSREELK